MFRSNKTLLRIANRVATVPAQEGALLAPDGQVLSLMGKLLTAKYSIENSYRCFSDRIRGPWRDSLVDHWHEHAKDERKSAYDIAMKIIALGGEPSVTTIQIPPSDGTPQSLGKLLISQELEAIQVCRELIILAGDQTSLRLLAEETVILDSHHLDDLRRMSFDI